MPAARSVPPQSIQPPAPTLPVARWEWLGLGCALLLAAFGVGWQPGSYAVQMDTAEFTLIGRAIVNGQALPLVGANVASGDAGHWAGPLLYYLCALPHAVFSRLDAAAAGFGALLVLAVLWLWQVGRRLFGPVAALATAILYGGCAHAWLESRLNFYTALAPALLVAALRLGLAWAERGGSWPLFGAVALLGALVQLHVVHVAYAALLGLVAVLWRRPPAPLPLLAGAASWAAMQAPWLVAQLQSNWADVAQFARWWQQRSTTGTGRSALRALHTLESAVTAPLELPAAVYEAQGLPPSALWSAAAGVLACCALLGLALGPVQPVARRGLGLVLGWIAVPLGLLVLGREGVYSFHVLGVLPALALLGGLGAAAAQEALSTAWSRTQPRRAKTLAQGLLVAALGVYAAGNVEWLVGVSERSLACGQLQYPMRAILSFPDALWRFRVPIAFPTVQSLAALDAALAAHGLDPEQSGQVHGPAALHLGSFPPHLPPARPGVQGQPQPASQPHVLLQPASCAAPDTPFAWQIQRLIPAQVPAVQLQRPGREPMQLALPAQLPTTGRLAIHVAAGTDAALDVWTHGPLAVRMDRPEPPVLDVRLDGATVQPEARETAAGFWLTTRHRFRIRSPRDGQLTIARRGTGKVVLDAIWQATGVSGL